MKRIFAAVLALAVLACLMPTMAFATEDASSEAKIAALSLAEQLARRTSTFGIKNTGASAEDPFLISTGAQLKELAGYVNAGNTDFNAAHYKQVADISLAAYQEGMGWEPIGTNDQPFKGVYDGQGKSITGLVINNSNTASQQGLFGRVWDDDYSTTRTVQLKNIVVKDANINVSAGSNIGAVVGWYTGSEDKPLTGCVMLGGSVTGGDTIGGVAGYATRDVEKCYATGSVNGGSQVGGVVGGLCADLCNCYSTGDVTGTGS